MTRVRVIRLWSGSPLFLGEEGVIEPDGIDRGNWKLLRLDDGRLVAVPSSSLRTVEDL